MIAIGPLNVRLDLLVFMVSLLVLYIGFKKIGLTEKDRDAVLGTWFAGFLAWKLSAIIIGLTSTGSLALSLYATGGIWSILVATATIGFFVFRLAPGLRGYWLFSALLLWFGVTIVVPKYGTLPFIATAQPLHLYTALLIAGLIVVTWRWMRSPSVGALLWTTVGAFAIWLVSTYATTTVNLLWLIPFAALVGLAGYVVKPSRRIVQSGLGVLVALAIINASLPDETPTLVADSSQAAGLNIGQVPPNFELKRTDGTTLNLEDLRGERVVVNFWASWCPPCRAEMPDMAKFAREQDDVTIVAVNTTTSERDVDEARSFVAPYEDAFQVVYDEDGAVGNAYRIQAMPTTYVLDENGVIVAKQFGAIDKAWLDTKTN
ncbi:redoxin domain-containing protein [Exiguobacterium sp. SH3S2]|uniref:TlpA disulfide reductase family protein n=1 Tax=unclassified Exiguobacterium TaxID=2644629 RepID=UPI00103957E6|nr:MULTISPECIES: TlpA disulfide reductase family protein [unclassified Exiguobacterium]TCI44085.1 redoxin domain-containing protein [Exiguobacterium sp. SH3S3]TCI59542.1 redoxin domain-containing protein [Exiguobacterium sp. SH3S2]